MVIATMTELLVVLSGLFILIDWSRAAKTLSENHTYQSILYTAYMYILQVIEGTTICVHVWVKAKTVPYTTRTSIMRITTVTEKKNKNMKILQ